MNDGLWFDQIEQFTTRWNNLPSLPISRENYVIGTALDSHRMVVIRGHFMEGNTILMYDDHRPRSSAWTPITSLSSEIINAGTAIDGKLVIVNGATLLSNDDDEENAVYLLDLDEKKSTKLPPLKHELYHTTILSHSHHLYVLGGSFNIDTTVTRDSWDNPLLRTGDIFQRLNTTTLRWEDNLPSMPTQRMNYSVAAIGSDIYVVGGITTDHFGRRCVTDVVEVLDTTRMQWRVETTMPKRLFAASAVGVGRYMVVTGGLEETVYEVCPGDEVFVYDGGKGVWKVLPVRMGCARYNHVSAVLNERKLIVAGGVGSRSSQVVFDVEELVLFSTWDIIRPLAMLRWLMQRGRVEEKRAMVVTHFDNIVRYLVSSDLPEDLFRRIYSYL